MECGQQIRFLQEIWLGDKLFTEAYPDLCRNVRKKDDARGGKYILRPTPLNVSFRRGLVDANHTSWVDFNGGPSAKAPQADAWAATPPSVQVSPKKCQPISLEQTQPRPLS